MPYAAQKGMLTVNVTRKMKEGESRLQKRYYQDEMTGIAPLRAVRDHNTEKMLFHIEVPFPLIEILTNTLHSNKYCTILSLSTIYSRYCNILSSLTICSRFTEVSKCLSKIC